MKKNLAYYILSGVGLLLGAAGGYAVYFYVGCEGGCPLRSNAPFMTGYGALVGIVAMQSVVDITARIRRARQLRAASDSPSPPTVS